MNQFDSSNVSINGDETTVSISGVVRDNLTELASPEDGGTLENVYVYVGEKLVSTIPLQRIGETSTLWRPYACRFTFAGTATIPTISGTTNINLSTSMNAMGEKGVANLSYTINTDYPNGEPTIITSTLTFTPPAADDPMPPSDDVIDTLVLTLPTTPTPTIISCTETEETSNIYLGSMGDVTYEVTITAGIPFSDTADVNDYCDLQVKIDDTLTTYWRFFETDTNTLVFERKYYSTVLETHTLIDTSARVEDAPQSWTPFAVQADMTSECLEDARIWVEDEEFELLETNGKQYAAGSPAKIFILPRWDENTQKQYGTAYSDYNLPENNWLKSIYIQQAIIERPKVKWVEVTPPKEYNNGNWYYPPPYTQPAYRDTKGWKSITTKVLLKGNIVEVKEVSEVLLNSWETRIDEFNAPYDAKELKGAKIKFEVIDLGGVNNTRGLNVSILKEIDGNTVTTLIGTKNLGAYFANNSSVTKFDLKGEYGGVQIVMSFKVDRYITISPGYAETILINQTELQKRILSWLPEAFIKVRDKLFSKTVEGTIDIYPLAVVPGSITDVTVRLEANTINTTAGGIVSPSDNPRTIKANDSFKIGKVSKDENNNDIFVNPISAASVTYSNESTDEKYISSMTGTIDLTGDNLRAPGEYTVAYTIADLDLTDEDFPQKFKVVKPIHVILMLPTGNDGNDNAATRPYNDREIAQSALLIEDWIKTKVANNTAQVVRIALWHDPRINNPCVAPGVLRISKLWDYNIEEAIKTVYTKLKIKDYCDTQLDLKHVAIRTIDIIGHGAPFDSIILDHPPNTNLYLTTKETGYSHLNTKDFMQDIESLLLDRAEIHIHTCYSAYNTVTPGMNIAYSMIDAIDKPLMVSGHEGSSTLTENYTHTADRDYTFYNNKVNSVFKTENGNWYYYQRNIQGDSVAIGSALSRTNRTTKLFEVNGVEINYQD